MSNADFRKTPGFTRDRNHPQASATCDQCGDVYNHYKLVKQMIYAGTDLVWNGFLVCETCFDQPNPQNRPIKIPPDPKPIKNPRHI